MKRNIGAAEWEHKIAWGVAMARSDETFVRRLTNRMNAIAGLSGKSALMTHEVKSWIHPDEKRRVMPRAGIAIILEEAQNELAAEKVGDS